MVVFSHLHLPNNLGGGAGPWDCRRQVMVGKLHLPIGNCDTGERSGTVIGTISQFSVEVNNCKKVGPKGQIFFLIY